VKSSETVLHGCDLRPGTHVNSVGTARPDQREIDVDIFTRAASIVVDTKAGVFGEAGDAIAARDAIVVDDVVELAALVATGRGGRTSDDAITLFKSVGTGLQDIGLAAAVYQSALSRGIGVGIGAFPYLKGR
jgi:ornithine cyclodeaminase/alanine dehydrogenase-like protein (mu-crystallin family)